MHPKYSMSFTSGTLLYRESILIATLFAELGEWTAVRDRVVDENLLQMRTNNASQRIAREVVSRLRPLTPEQLDLLTIGDQQEQRHLLWLAVCKRYQFIRDFASEVLHTKYQGLEHSLTYLDYDIYYNNKAEWHPEVDNVAPSTRLKGRSVVFKMLREADLLTEDQQIVPAVLSSKLSKLIYDEDPDLLTIYPAPLTVPRN